MLDVRSEVRGNPRLNAGGQHADRRQRPRGAGSRLDPVRGQHRQPAPRPVISAVLPLGLTGSGRGSGHIANFVKPDCSQLWVDGGNHVEVVDLSATRARRARSGKFESAASRERQLQRHPRHRARQHRHALVGRRRRGRRLPADRRPAGAAAARDHRRRREQPLALQRLHPPQLAAAREDAARHRGGLHRHGRGAARRLPRSGQVRDLGPLAARPERRSRRRTPGRPS